MSFGALTTDACSHGGGSFGLPTRDLPSAGMFIVQLGK